RPDCHNSRCLPSADHVATKTLAPIHATRSPRKILLTNTANLLIVKWDTILLCDKSNRVTNLYFMPQVQTALTFISHSCLRRLSSPYTRRGYRDHVVSSAWDSFQLYKNPRLS